MTTIHLDKIVKTFGETEVTKSIEAHLASGEFTVILGPSGCGKSTLLNMIAGLETVTSGSIRFDAREVQDLPPKDRGCAMVFQNYALYPHMSVAENIGYALKVAGVPKVERARRVALTADIVELGDYLARKPSELSGGQRQRVAIARAIVREPKVLLFDEPLSNLDAKLRHGMRMELAELHKRIGATSVFVTHDQVEAMTLADRVMILNQGRVEQFAPPSEIYHRPASRFVAGFIGSPPMNILSASADGSCLRLENGPRLHDSDMQGPLTIGIRPEKIEICTSGIPVRVKYREDLGAYVSLVALLPGGQQINVTATPDANVEAADELHLRFPPQHLHYFHPETGLRLN